MSPKTLHQQHLTIFGLSLFLACAIVCGRPFSVGAFWLILTAFCLQVFLVIEKAVSQPNFGPN
jgi:hypothetical protein